jgi:hypothetical protein
MGRRDRLRKLENRCCDRGPILEEVSDAWERITDCARRKLCGETVNSD